MNYCGSAASQLMRPSGCSVVVSWQCNIWMLTTPRHTPDFVPTLMSIHEVIIRHRDSGSALCCKKSMAKSLNMLLLLGVIKIFVPISCTWILSSFAAETQKHTCSQTMHPLLTLNDHSRSLFKCRDPSAAKLESACGEERLCKHLEWKNGEGYEQVYGPHSWVVWGLLCVDRFHTVSGAAGLLTWECVRHWF